MRTIGNILAIAVMLAAFFFVATAAQAGVCMRHEAMVAKLKQTSDEQLVGLGLGPLREEVFELFVSEIGSWTLLRTSRSGFSCIVVFGDSWQTTSFQPGEPV